MWTSGGGEGVSEEERDGGADVKGRGDTRQRAAAQFSLALMYILAPSRPARLHANM